MFITVSSNKNDSGNLIFRVCETYCYYKNDPLASMVMYLGTLRQDVIDSVREGKANPMQAWWIAEKIMNADFTDNDKHNLISQLAQHLPVVTTNDLKRFQQKAKQDRINDHINDPVAMNLKWDDWMLQAMEWM